MKITITITLLIISICSFAKNIAQVNVVKGVVTANQNKVESRILKKGDWLQEGETVITAKKSFVRLRFIDDSKVNVGPKSQVKIEQFKDDTPGVLNVVTGKIRAEVSKDYLKMQKNKSKLFVRSNNAVMGIRGTDFLFTSNSKTNNTVAVLFEGSVIFNYLKSEDIDNISNYESIVNEGQRIKPGEFSSVSNSGRFFKPQKLNKVQLIKLHRNKEVSDSSKSFVPKGLNESIVSSSKNAETLKNDSGSIIHINSGKIITDSVLKKKGIISDSGEFVFSDKIDIKKGVDINKEHSNELKGIPQPQGESFRPASFLHAIPPSKRPIQKKPSKVNINIENPG